MADSVLIIGGEPDFREKLDSSLTEAGYEVTSTPNCVSAGMIIENLVPDIIILDEIHQNGDDSFAVCKHLYDDYGIPIILLGEDSSDEVWERVMEVEADLYQIKPLSYPVLVARIKAILRRYKSRGLAEHRLGLL